VPSRQHRSIKTEFFLQLRGTRHLRRLHAIQCLQSLSESDLWWWSYDAFKLGRLQCYDIRVAHRPNWLIGCTGTVVLATAPLVSPSDQLLSTTTTVLRLHNVTRHVAMSSLQVTFVQHHYVTSLSSFAHCSLTPTGRKPFVLAPCPVTLLKPTQMLRTYASDAEMVSGNM
jgi:hypothetical protein